MTMRGGQGGNDWPGPPPATQVLDEYARLAPVYDRKWGAYVHATTRETLACMRLVRTGRVLDVGCGTGVLLEHLARSGAGTSLVGLDPVPGMLVAARSRLRGTASLAMGRAESLPFRDGSFDTLISCSVFHFIERPRGALQEAARVLAPGGYLVLTDWCADFVTTRMLGWWMSVRRRPLSHVYRVGELARLLEAAGFQSVVIERFRVGPAWGLMTAVALKPRSPPP